jgi:hypothetical protein
MLSVLAHEITETATDPLLMTWFNSNGDENADICAWQFGTLPTSGVVYNVVGSNGKKYLLQRNHNPKTGMCVAAA